MKKNIIILILIVVIFMLVIKNNIDRRTDRLIQKIEFQKILDGVQLPPQIKFPEKIYL